MVVRWVGQRPRKKVGCPSASVVRPIFLQQTDQVAATTAHPTLQQVTAGAGKLQHSKLRRWQLPGVQLREQTTISSQDQGVGQVTGSRRDQRGWGLVGKQIGQKSGGDLGVAHTILIQGKAVPTVAGELGCREHGRHKGLGCFALLMQRF